MSDRRTNSEKWETPWFREIPVESKVLFLYILDNCDIAGFINVDADIWSPKIGISKNGVLGALKHLEGTSKITINGRICWVNGFLEKQGNLPLNMKNNAHLSAARKIIANSDKFPEAVKWVEGITYNENGRLEGVGRTPVMYCNVMSCNVVKSNSVVEVDNSGKEIEM